MSIRILCANDCYKSERFSILKNLKTLYQAESRKCLLLFAGDFLGGSLFSVRSQGEAMIRVCNEVGFDYVTLGNHEFDYGASRTAELMDKSSFPWLGSNIRLSADCSLFHTILDVDCFEIPYESGTLKIGIFGLCTQQTPKLANPTDLVVFEDALKHAKRCTDILKRENNCDIVIAMTHVTLECDKSIAELGGVDVIIGGHEHDPFFLRHRGTLIIKCGQDLDHLGILDLNVKRQARGRINVDYSFQLLSTEGFASDPAIDEIIKSYDTRLEGDNVEDEILCLVSDDTELSTLTSELRTKETAFACHLTDAVAWSYSNSPDFNCDFCIWNGGFVRRDMLYHPGSIITKSVISEELPFPRKPVLIAMTGADVILALRQMLPPTSTSGPLGCYPHISEGLSAKYCYPGGTEGPGGEPVVDVSRSHVFDVRVRGQPIDLEREYSVGASDFYVSSEGDGITAFLNKRIIASHEKVVSEVVIEYLRTLDAIDGRAPGRLVKSVV